MVKSLMRVCFIVSSVVEKELFMYTPKLDAK